jgi:hypothetical protein
MTTLRLTLKQQRFEITVLAVATIAIAVVALVVIGRLVALPVEIANCQDPLTCGALGEELFQLMPRAFPIAALSAVIPVFAGLVIGVAVVAREIERGTAWLPWSFSPSRRTWLLRRVAVLGAVVGALALVPAVTSEMLASAANPGVDLGASFRDTGTRGPVIIARALAAFGVAVLAGAVLGRTLPALLLAMAGIAAVSVGSSLGQDIWLRAEAYPIPDTASVDDAFIRDVAFVLPDGRLVDWDTAWTELTDPNSSPMDAFPQRYIGIPGTLAPEKRAREAAIILAVGLVAAALATAVVERRRPT